MDPSQQELTALDGFLTIREIWEMPNDDLRSGRFVSVIGLLKDFQAPIETKGSCEALNHLVIVQISTDTQIGWKCSLKIIDHSIRSHKTGLQFTIFWPKSSMPMTPTVADVVVIKRAKSQMYAGISSLLASKYTILHILPAKDVPRSTSDAYKTYKLWSSCSFDHGPETKNISHPRDIEIRYAISMNDKKSTLLALPSSEEFESKINKVKVARDKFSLLKDVELKNFYNIIGEVQKIWLSSNQNVTVYLSDYTANTQFYNYVATKDLPDFEDRDGDDFCYTYKRTNKTSGPGLPGKLTMQITLWDGDADLIREKVEVGNWLHIRNILIKMGNKNIIEGSVNSHDGQIHVQKLKQSNCSSEIDKHWKAALQRKKTWWNGHGQNLQSKRKNFSEKVSRNKRKYIDDDEISAQQPKNCKQRRREERAEADKKCARIDAKLQLNENIQAAYPEQMIVSLKDILAPSYFCHPGPETFYAPFTNCKYRASVRVVDYFPNEIKRFAIDCGAEEAENLDSGRYKDDDSNLESTWEWRFSLLLEDASNPKAKHKERLWVLVNNHAAQGLLNMEEDASNLQENPTLLAKLKEQLFKLWGNLEELKSAALEQDKSHMKESLPSSPESEESFTSLPTNLGNQPDLDSDIEKEQVTYRLNKLRLSAAAQIDQVTNPNKLIDNQKLGKNITPSNKAFICCIQQYGVKVPESDQLIADAGPRERWQRQFGLFGTKIL